VAWHSTVSFRLARNSDSVCLYVSLRFIFRSILRSVCSDDRGLLH